MTLNSKNTKIIEKIKKITKNIDGWLSNREGEFLYKNAKKCSKKGVIVEIGSWKGKSTIWLATASKNGNKVKVYAIDPHIGSSEHKKMFGKVWTFEEFKKNIKKAGVKELVVPVVKTSEDASKAWKKKVGMLWIDGAHEYEFVEKDYLLWEPHLLEGGIIAFHDTVADGPKKVVDKYIFPSNKFVDIGFVDGIVYAKKVKKNTFNDRLKNKYVKFIRGVYILSGKLNMPRPVKSFGKKIFDALK